MASEFKKELSRLAVRAAQAGWKYDDHDKKWRHPEKVRAYVSVVQLVNNELGDNE